MGIIVAVIAPILCLVFYVRMVKREVPEPMPKKKAAAPVVVGLFALIPAALFTFGIGFIILQFTGGGSLSETIGNPVLSSLAGSFLAAGLTEEVVKLLMFLLIFRWLKVQNVYEHAVLLSGIGIGFTISEEISYGAGSPLTALTRLPAFALHMLFGLIMGLFLGLARYKKQHGESCVREICLAFVLPVLWHTLFDSSTAFNSALYSEETRVQVLGVVIWVIALVVSTVLQFWILIRFKKDTEKYCAMELEN